VSNNHQIRVQEVTKVVVTVAEMARMVGLSRARFYQLIGCSAFPHPVYDVATRRPCYDENMQKTCFMVKQRNRGVDGKPVMFYARRTPTVTPRPATKPRTAAPKRDPLVDSIKALGLASVTSADVLTAVAELYPNGIGVIDRGEVIRAVFLRLKCQNRADSEGR